MSAKTTKMLAVIGSPIAHSLSPAMHNAAIRAAQLDFLYIALPVLPASLGDGVRGLRALGFRGFNVTLPHKSAILPFLDEIDDAARTVGAVNTVVCEDGKLKGFNTDVEGFLSALKAHGFSLRNKNVVLFGAGGAARALLYGLLKEGAANVTIGVRNIKKVRPLLQVFSKYGELCAFDWHDAAFARAVKDALVLINATPLGMSPNTKTLPPVPWDAVRTGAFFCDLIYTPKKTLFLQRAAMLDCPTLNGEAMLVRQGAAAFTLWTGIKPDIFVMTRALQDALKNVSNLKKH